jgi:hypothetical protein
MSLKINRAAPVLAVVAVSVFVSPVRAQNDIFGEPQWWGPLDPDYAVVPGDFDHDCDIDLFSVAPPQYDPFGQPIGPGDYTINFNTDGLGSFSSQTLIATRGAYTIFAEDLNADGDLDIIDGDLGVALGNGDGTIGPFSEYSNGSGHGNDLGLAFGDMDGDGDTDIVVPNDGPVLLNNGDGTFYTNFVASYVAAGIAAAVCDINEDGHLDVATIQANSDVVTIQLGLGDGQGNPGEPYTVLIGGEYPADLALTDMNGDHHLDLVTLNRGGTDDVSVVLGNGDGAFGAPVTYQSSGAAYFLVDAFKVADVTSDGAPDVIVTSTVYGDATSHPETGVLLNDGAGVLSLQQTVAYFGTSSQNIAAADFDDDGNTDLATATQLLFNQLPATIGMGVEPRDDFLAIGPYGGPFTPESKTYTLTNNDDLSIDYSVTKNADWLTIDNGAGAIPPGGSVDVVVRINDNANTLGIGDYEDTISITNLTDHHGDRTRDVTLQVGIPQVMYSFPLDSDPSWQTEGDWAFGQPTGQGGAHGSPDPTSGYTGPNVYGYNLNGDYPGGLGLTSLTTDAIDCSNLSHVTLRFRRWLGVRDQPDDASVRLSIDGQFFLTLWFNEDEVYDGDWQLVEYDLSPFADDESTVYVQWTLGPTYLGGACGWNIDDIEILGVEMGVPCPADVDGSGGIDVLDLLMLLGAWGTNGPGADIAEPLDVVDVHDLLGLLADWGACP